MSVEFKEMKSFVDNCPQERLLEIGLPDIQFYNVGGMYHALCPFHPDTHLGNFMYNPYNHIWKCFVCGEGGVGVVNLVMAVTGKSYTETVAMLYENRSRAGRGVAGNSHVSIKCPSGKKPSAGFNNGETTSRSEASSFSYIQKPLPAEQLDAIYTCFAAASPLTRDEKDKLMKKRGLYNRSMSHFFRFPSNGDPEFRSLFLQKLAVKSKELGVKSLRNQLLNVPGFMWDSERRVVSFIGYSGALGILNHDADGLINGIELRLRDGNPMGVRYIPFSSTGICQRYPDRFRYGTKLTAIVDVVPPAFDDKAYLGVAVTEGKMKAIHLSYMGYLALNVRGVGNWKEVLPILDLLKSKGYDTQRVFIAFDADSRKNPAVANHCVNFAEALMGQGREAQFLAWPATCGKGIDDVDNNGKTNRIRTVEGTTYLETTLKPFLMRVKRNQNRARSQTSA